MTEVKAPLTGTVWQIVVNVGDSVSEDDDLIILESMKMEIPVGAPHDGTVQEVLVQQGQPITEGQVLVRLSR